MLSMLMTTEYAPAEDRHELQQLLIHIAGGEREALAELYQRTRSAVYGLALSYLKNAQDAQDLTQDVYVHEIFIFYDSSSSNCQFFSADIAAPRFLLNMQS